MPVINPEKDRDTQPPYNEMEVSADEAMRQRIALFKDRCATVVELADWLQMFYVAKVEPGADDRALVTDAIKPALRDLQAALAEAPWQPAGIMQSIKATLAQHNLKLPQLAIPLRVLVCGRSQTPAIDAVLALFPRDVVMSRLSDGLAA